MSNPYNWTITDGNWPKWIRTHKINIDYKEPLSWDPKNWGEWGNEKKGGPPVRLENNDRFWYVDRVKVAKFILKYPGRNGNIKKEGQTFVLRVGLMVVLHSKYEVIARAALAALNGGDIMRTLALEPAYIKLPDEFTSLEN